MVKMPLGTEVGLGLSHIVLGGYLAPRTEKGIAASNFSVHIYCAQTAGCISIHWYGDRPRRSRHCGKWGPSSPTERSGAARHFLAHVYCGQIVAHLWNCRTFVWALLPELSD